MKLHSVSTEGREKLNEIKPKTIGASRIKRSFTIRYKCIINIYWEIMKVIKYCPICNSESFETYMKSKDFSVSKEDFVL